MAQPALSINMDAHTNCESLSFTFDNQLREMPAVFVYNELTKIPIPIPIPNITPLSPPLVWSSRWQSSSNQSRAYRSSRSRTNGWNG